MNTNAGGMWPVVALVVCIMASQVDHGDGLECYACSNVSYVALCQSVVQCPAGHICHKTVTSIGYTLGCKPSDICDVVSTGSGGGATIVGRSMTSSKRSVTSTSDCSECCETGLCNRQLCQNNDTDCHDSGHIDCATTGAFVDICSQSGHFKKECWRYCGYCSMVDGGWSSWSGWSTCSVTCGNGTVTRVRSCSNPAPADGGTDCVGATSDTRVCSHDPCPVDGGWGTWSAWGTCSVSCGVGMQHRSRACSSPHPANTGLNCLGTATGVNVCTPGTCNDGVWSTWGAWSSCSVTCGVCSQKRHRSCTGQTVGRVCVGDNMDVSTKPLKSCAVDGSWGTWSAWSACSVSCGVGMQHRTRSCSSPNPTHAGLYCLGETTGVNVCTPGTCNDGVWSTWGAWSSCSVPCGVCIQKRHRSCTGQTVGSVCVGDNIDVKTNQLKSCVATSVAFVARSPPTSLPRNVQIIFGTTVLNSGGAYNNSTGIFTAPVSGTYMFSAQLCPVNRVYFQLRVNYNVLGVSTDRNDQNVQTCSSMSTVAVMQAGQLAWVEEASGGAVVRSDSTYSYWNMFTGVLVNPN